MSDARLTELFTFVFFLLFVITGYRAVSASTKGSYLLKSTESEFVFMRPVDLFIWLFVAMGLSCIYGGTLITLIPISSLVQQPLSTLTSTISWLVVGFSFLGFSKFVKASLQKKFVLKLDRGSRTYRTFVESPASERSKIVAGFWTDIACVSLVPAVDPGGEGNWPAYWVQLQWHHPVGQYSVLGGFAGSDKDKAEVFAAQIARELELPVVAESF